MVCDVCEKPGRNIWKATVVYRVQISLLWLSGLVGRRSQWKEMWMSHVCRDRYHRALPYHHQHLGAVQYYDERLKRGNYEGMERGMFCHMFVWLSEQFELRYTR